MSQYERFSLHIQRLIQLSTAEPGLDPDTVSEEILNFLSRENTSEEEEEELGNFFEERNIKYLVHFTHRNNLKNILKFGLIPRAYLEETVIKIALSPIFPDNCDWTELGKPTACRFLSLIIGCFIVCQITTKIIGRSFFWTLM